MLAVENNTSVNMNVQVCIQDLDSVLLGIFLEVKLLGHMVILFLIF